MGNKDLKILTPRKFEDALEEIDDFYLRINNLLEIIKNCELVRENGKILDNKRIELAKIILDDSEYSLKEEVDKRIRWRERSYLGHYHFLEKNRKEVLVSMQFLSYISSSTNLIKNGFFSHVETHAEKIYLLEEDRLARDVFGKIKNKKMKLEEFLEKEKDVKGREYGKLWSFLLVKGALNLPMNLLDKRYRWVGGGGTSIFDIKGKLIEDGSRNCLKCNSKKIVAGTYKLKYEVSMHSDNSDYQVERKSFKVCLDCLHNST